VVAITLGTAGALVLSTKARHVSHQAPVSKTRYTVTAPLWSPKGGPVRACLYEVPSSPGWSLGCGGVEVTNADVESIPLTFTYQGGAVKTPIVKLVGIWEGHALRLSEQPQVTMLKPTEPKPWIVQSPPTSSGKTHQQLMEELKRDSGDLEKRGIIVLMYKSAADLDITLAVADANSVQYLYDRYGRMQISGWLQPVNVATETPLPSRSPSPTPSPTVWPQSTVPTTAQLSALSDRVVWAFIDRGVLFRSTDKGNTWEQRSLPALVGHDSLLEVSFVDDRQGWVLFARQCAKLDAEVWHTTDGAATWQKVAVQRWTPYYASDGEMSTQCKQGLSFVDPMHGFLAGWAPWRQPNIYRTFDGGKTWSGSPLPDPPDFRTEGGNSLRAGAVKRFGSTLYVEAWGKQPGEIRDRQYMFRSTDSGATWSWMTNIPSPYIAMVTESRWLQLLVPGRSMESTDSGQQWHLYASDFNTNTAVGGPQIVFADSQVAYAGGQGQIQRTVDGGLHWTRINTPTWPSVVPDPLRLTSQKCTGEPLTTSARTVEGRYTMRVPSGWADTGDYVHRESPLLELTAPASYGYSPTRIQFLALQYDPKDFGPEGTAHSIAVAIATKHDWSILPDTVATSVSDCAVAAEPAAVFGYANGSEQGYWLFMVRQNGLYGIRLVGTGGVGDQAIEDALAMLGSIAWKS
jgi:photosystem II stability/assembly factor-like uncharacterized protein